MGGEKARPKGTAKPGSSTLNPCVYGEMTNECHLIANVKVERGPYLNVTVVCAHEKLYALNSYGVPKARTVECDDRYRNEWYEKTTIRNLLFPKMLHWSRKQIVL